MTEQPKPTTEAPDAVRGADAMIGTPPTITIAGREYPLRRLGVEDVMRIAQIIGRGFYQLGTTANLAGLDDDDMASTMTTAMIAGAYLAERQTLDLLASVIGVNGDDFRDPEQFPMEAVPLIIEALMAHQDMRAFFTQVGVLLQRMPRLLEPKKQA